MRGLLIAILVVVFTLCNSFVQAGPLHRFDRGDSAACVDGKCVIPVQVAVVAPPAVVKEKTVTKQVTKSAAAPSAPKKATTAAPAKKTPVRKVVKTVVVEVKHLRFRR